MVKIEITTEVPYGYVAYGALPIDLQRKAGCTWIVNGEQCKKKWVNDYTYYCEEHKDIPDSKRVIHDPLTTCRKRKPFTSYVPASNNKCQ